MKKTNNAMDGKAELWEFIHKIESLSDGMCRVGLGIHGFGVKSPPDSEISMMIMLSPDPFWSRTRFPNKISEFELSITQIREDTGEVISLDEVSGYLRSENETTKKIAETILNIGTQTLHISSEDFILVREELLERDLSRVEFEEHEAPMPSNRQRMI